jgi:histidinol dehydrogenase
MPEIRRLDTLDPGFASALAKLTARDKAEDDAIDASVASIVTDVRVRGDAAVLEYTALFDRVKATSVAALELPAAEL